MERLTRRTKDDTVLLTPEHEELYTQNELIDKLLDRLAAYEDAEEQGRLVVLPCKIGDLVWSIDFDTSGCQFCLSIGECFGCRHANQINASCFPFQLRHYNQIGKTIFLSREEAEAALAKERDM